MRKDFGIKTLVYPMPVFIVAPIIADKDDKPLFSDSKMSDFKLIKTDTKDGVLILNYKRS